MKKQTAHHGTFQNPSYMRNMSANNRQTPYQKAASSIAKRNGIQGFGSLAREPDDVTDFDEDI